MSVTETAADNLRCRLAATSLPVDPFDIAAKLEIRVCEDDATGYLGSLFRLGGSCSISVNANIRELGRKNFTVAHELGHHQLHPDTTRFNCSKGHLNLFKENNPLPEQEANDFASFLLLPTDLIKPFVSMDEPTFRDVCVLANKANASITATALRFVTYNEIPCALVMIKKGQIRWFKKTDDFPFQVMTGPVAPRTMAYGFHTKGTVPPSDEAWETPLDCWCETRGTRDVRIQETCFAMKNYDISLSLIYPCEDSQDVLDEDEQEEEWEEPRFKKR